MRWTIIPLLAAMACTGGADDGDDGPATGIDTDPVEGGGIVDPGLTTDTADTDAPLPGDTDDTDPPEDTADIATKFDCTTPPALPYAVDTLTGFGTAEDFDLDDLGFHVSVISQQLKARDQQGTVEIRATSVSSEASGTRILPDGSVAVNRVAQGSIVRVDPNGSKTVFISGLEYPNGLEVDTDGFVYVAEQSGGRVRRVDPYTGDQWVLAEGLNAPNGIIFGPDYQRLYFNSFGGGSVHYLEKVSDTVYDGPYLLAERPTGGGFDGINVDVCGNIYVTEYIAGKVWRVRPDGSAVEMAANLPSSWIPNIRWGTDKGGFDAEVLYVSDRDQGRLFGLQVGLPGKPPVWLP